MVVAGGTAETFSDVAGELTEAVKAAGGFTGAVKVGGESVVTRTAGAGEVEVKFGVDILEMGG